MATATEKKQVLDEWNRHFPLHHKWKSQFLIQRNGAMLSGICLDETRDPRSYRPVFFFHNLLVPSKVITLAYAAPLLSRGVYKPLKYGFFSESDVHEFRQQITLCQEDISFEGFVNHIVETIGGRYGAQAVYLPHALRDILTVGSYLGDSAYYLSTLDKVSSLIETKPGINLSIIGSVDQWQKTVSQLIHQANELSIQAEIQAHGLPALDDLGMDYQRIENYWEYFF